MTKSEEFVSFREVLENWQRNTVTAEENLSVWLPGGGGGAGHVTTDGREDDDHRSHRRQSSLLLFSLSLSLKHFL